MFLIKPRPPGTSCGSLLIYTEYQTSTRPRLVHAGVGGSRLSLSTHPTQSSRDKHRGTTCVPTYTIATSCLPLHSVSGRTRNKPIKHNQANGSRRKSLLTGRDGRGRQDSDSRTNAPPPRLSLSPGLLPLSPLKSTCCYCSYSCAPGLCLVCWSASPRSPLSRIRCPAAAAAATRRQNNEGGDGEGKRERGGAEVCCLCRDHCYNPDHARIRFVRDPSTAKRSVFFFTLRLRVRSDY